MKPTSDQIVHAVGRLGGLAFFPTDEAAKAEIMRLLQRLVSTSEQLEWLCTTMLDRVGTWRGPVELRGVFCTKFKPADGIEANCLQTAGFTAMDSEAAYLDDPELKLLRDPEARRMIESLKG
jgi:hypothetical protein